MELLAQLEAAKRDHRALKRKLKAAERRADELQETQQQILSSTSWKITAPLRTLRMRMGAPPPVDVSFEVDFPDDEGDLVMKADTGIALLPSDLPDKVVAANLFEALRTNEVCQIMDLDWTMRDLVPDEFLEGLRTQKAVR